MKVLTVAGRAGWAALLAVVVVGCGSGDPAKEAVDELKTARSWAATAEMVGEAWMRGATPTPYTADTLEAAHEELQKEAARVDKKPDVQAAAGVDLVGHFKTVDGLALALHDAVEAGDRAAAGDRVGRLAAEASALADAIANAGGQG
jgi:hypothetical protein